jgi:hypothetical protein
MDNFCRRSADRGRRRRREPLCRRRREPLCRRRREPLCRRRREPFCRRRREPLCRRRRESHCRRQRKQVLKVQLLSAPTRAPVGAISVGADASKDKKYNICRRRREPLSALMQARIKSTSVGADASPLSTPTRARINLQLLSAPTRSFFGADASPTVIADASQDKCTTSVGANASPSLPKFEVKVSSSKPLGTHPCRRRRKFLSLIL